MMVAVVLQAEAVRGLDDVEPLRGGDLVGTNDRPDLVVEHLRRCPRQRSEPRGLQLDQEITYRDAERGGALPDFERGKSMDMDGRADSP